MRRGGAGGPALQNLCSERYAHPSRPRRFQPPGGALRPGGVRFCFRAQGTLHPIPDGARLLKAAPSAGAQRTFDQ